MKDILKGVYNTLQRRGLHIDHLLIESGCMNNGISMDEKYAIALMTFDIPRSRFGTPSRWKAGTVEIILLLSFILIRDAS